MPHAPTSRDATGQRPGTAEHQFRSGKGCIRVCAKSAEEPGILILDKSQMEFRMAARENACHWS